MTGERLCYILFCIVTEKPEMQSVSVFVCIWVKHKGSFDVQPSNKNSTFTVWDYLLQLVDLTCCCCRGQPADEQCWPPLHNILTQNRTAPIKTDRKINCVSVFWILILCHHSNYSSLTWKNEINLPIWICESPSTTLVSDTETQMYIYLFFLAIDKESVCHWEQT